LVPWTAAGIGGEPVERQIFWPGWMAVQPAQPHVFLLSTLILSIVREDLAAISKQVSRLTMLYEAQEPSGLGFGDTDQAYIW
jgi:hypothetical protein